MNIGLLSDSHGNTLRTAAALKAMKAWSPVHILHCGDIGTQAVLDVLAAASSDPVVPVTCVLGNVDSWEGDLFAPLPHITIAGRFAHLEIGGRTLGVIHGDDIRQLASLIAGGTYDYIFTGHTHERADETRGRTRIINPGALQRTAEPGCAVLDLTTGRLDYVNL